MEGAGNVAWYRRLHWQIAIALVVGAIVGSLGGEAAVTAFGWMGTLFVRLLKMIIVPLVVTSIIHGVSSAGGGLGLGRLFGKTLGYYALSSLLAILVGLVAVNLIQPGRGVDFARAARADLPEIETPSSAVDLLLQIVPENVFGAAGSGDMLAIIFFSIVFAVAMAGLPRRHKRPLEWLFEAAFAAMMRLTGGIIALAPLGVFGLIVRVVGTTGFDTFRALLLYMATIASGLAVHLFVTLPLLLIVLGRIRPWIHFRNMTEPLAMAFSTSSSGATLPVTMTAVRQRVGVSNRVTSFVLPMGATINMDGTALYECAGVLFIAQVLGVPLGFPEQALVVLTALLASIGAAAVPSAGLVIIFIVLEAVNLRGPQVDALVGAMLAIDRPLDMARTAVNVFSDSCGAAIIARSEGETEVDAV